MRFLDIYDIAKDLNLSTRMVTGFIRKGDLKAYKFGPEVRVKSNDLDTFIERSRFHSSL